MCWPLLFTEELILAVDFAVGMLAAWSLAPRLDQTLATCGWLIGLARQGTDGRTLPCLQPSNWPATWGRPGTAIKPVFEPNQPAVSIPRSVIGRFGSNTALGRVGSMSGLPLKAAV